MIPAKSASPKRNTLHATERRPFFNGNSTHTLGSIGNILSPKSSVRNVASELQIYSGTMRRGSRPFFLHVQKYCGEKPI